VREGDEVRVTDEKRERDIKIKKKAKPPREHDMKLRSPVPRPWKNWGNQCDYRLKENYRGIPNVGKRPGA
jgi:hypothetical protein